MKTKMHTLNVPGIGPVGISLPVDDEKCKCGHPLHEKTCQEPVPYQDKIWGESYIGCGCFRVNGELPK